uniref:Uncharacterized protein n=1 Tax=Klebsiella pneumoniae TaxID=573 RepID=A0A8B0SU08_KLEPN|nr:hypothetical protein [Klebsiella pneumoniae]
MTKPTRAEQEKNPGNAVRRLHEPCATGLLPAAYPPRKAGRCLII